MQSEFSRMFARLYRERIQSLNGNNANGRTGNRCVIDNRIINSFKYRINIICIWRNIVKVSAITEFRSVFQFKQHTQPERKIKLKKVINPHQTFKDCLENAFNDYDKQMYQKAGYSQQEALDDLITQSELNNYNQLEWI